MQEPGRNQPPRTNQPDVQTSFNEAFGNRSPIPSPTEYAPSAMRPGQNDSGTGATAVLPAELKGFNWGAFFGGWIWSIAHSTWIGLLTLLFGIIMQVILGFKGNEWAWQNRKWESIEQFKTVQRIWARWGIGLFIVFIVFIALAMMSAKNTTMPQGNLNYTPR